MLYTTRLALDSQVGRPNPRNLDRKIPLAGATAPTGWLPPIIQYNETGPSTLPPPIIIIIVPVSRPKIKVVPVEEFTS